MNKDLKDKIYKIEPFVLSAIKGAMLKYPNNPDGIKRAEELLKNGTVTYGQLKRILHDMKKHSKNNEITEYELAGAKPFESWGWRTLNDDRERVKFDKKMRKNTDDVGGIQGRRNAYNKTTRRKSNFNTPANTMKSNSTTYTSDFKLTPLFEEIINQQKQ